MQTQNHPHARLRSSLADAAWAVEDRVVWGGATVLRGAADVLRWPFERATWAVERGVVWPLEERTASWNSAVRAAGLAAILVLAVGAGVLGATRAANSGSGTEAEVAAPATPTPVLATPAPESAAPAAPVLQGAPPRFAPEADGGVSKANAEARAAPAAAAGSDASVPSASGAASGKAAGPAALDVARQFAGAFVLFETGQDSDKVRAAFTATATPQLKQSLLQRPPRLPAGTEVPKAKVLNIVPGPAHGNIYTVSVSLLRVGVTSELRIDMQRSKDGVWRVTDVLG